MPSESYRITNRRVRIDADPSAGAKTVTNNGPGTLYYHSQADTVSTTVYEGTLTTGQTLSLTGTQHFVSDDTANAYVVTTQANANLQIPAGQGIYIPPNGLPFWKAARANAQAGAGLARVAVVGDSLTMYYASDLQATAWPALIRSGLQARYGDGGSGIHSVVDSTVILTNDARAAAIQTAWTNAGNLVTLSGTWDEVVNGTDGPGVAILRAKSIGAQATFKVRGTVVEIAYQTTPSGTAAGSFTYSIDGGAESGAVSSFHATQGTLEVLSIPVSAGSHTVRLTTTDTDGTTKFAWISGVSGRNASGVVVDRYSRGGAPSAAAANRLPGSFTWTNAAGTTFGGSAQNLRNGAGSWMGGSSRPADLIIYSLMANDAGAVNVTPDNFVFNVRDFLENVKNGTGQNGNTDVVFLIPHFGTIETATTRYATQYVDRIRGIAEGYGAAVVNVWGMGRNSWNYWNTLGRWGSSAAVSVAGTDSVHLSNAGHQAYADALLPVLTA